MSNEFNPTALLLDVPTPTLFLDYDGTLHRGTGVLDDAGNIALDTGNTPFEFAGELASLLRPYPEVEIVLTTSWLDKLPYGKVVEGLPAELVNRIVGTTKGIKPRFGYVKDGSARTYIIRCYVFDHKLKNWLALDDNVYGAFSLSLPFINLVDHLVLLDSSRGIDTPETWARVKDWLVKVHCSG